MRRITYTAKVYDGKFGECGLCSARRESIYNIDIMEEAVSILAFSAGAISKVVESGDGKICRAAAPKECGAVYPAHSGRWFSGKERFFAGKRACKGTNMAPGHAFVDFAAAKSIMKQS